MNIRKKFIAIFALIVCFTQFFSGLSYAQRYGLPFKKAKQMKDLEALSIEKISKGKWYVIQVNSGSISGDTTKPGQYYTVNMQKKADGPTGPWSVRYVGYWEIKQQPKGHSGDVQGGKYHWWKPTSVQSLMNYDPFILGGLILSKLNINKTYEKPDWRSTDNIRQIVKGNLKMITVPDHLKRTKTIYSERNFIPYYMVPDDWGPVVEKAIDILSGNQDFAVDKPTLQEVKETSNPLIACKRFQRLVEKTPVTISEYKELLPDKTGFQSQFYTYVFYKSRYENDRGRKKILNALRNSNDKNTFINAVASMFVIIDFHRELAIGDKKRYQFSKSYVQWLVKQKDKFQINSSSLNVKGILRRFKKEFPNLEPSSSVPSDD